MQKPRLNFQSSWDDGHELDLKLIELLKKHKLPGTFYLTTRCPMFHEIPTILESGFEVGGHTMTHPMDMKLLTEDQIDWEIGSNKKLLELEGAEVTKFCYPRGRYDDRVIECLRRKKFKSARTTTVLVTDPPTDPFRTATSIHIYPRTEYGDAHWITVAKRLIEEAVISNGIFHIWGHSWEIEKLNEWDNLDKFFDWIRETYDVEDL